MTLSILLPVYELDASALVSELLALAEAEHVDCELLVGDDASPTLVGWLDDIAYRQEVRVFRSEHNIGRAANRNRLADAAKGDWLLTVDCDARLLPQFSLRAYLRAARQAPVVCGGLCTPLTWPVRDSEPETPLSQASHASCQHDDDATRALRLRYELNADRYRSAEYRRRHPYDKFTLFNALIRRDIFQDIRLDGSLKEYGYEDALFGIDLQKRNIPIAHIDNPLLHTGIDTSNEFLQKTEASLHNLHHLQRQMTDHSRLLANANAICRWHLSIPTRLLFRLATPLLRRNLLGKNPSMTLFSFYKLGYYLNIR